jgi:multimeric flavodoxin WrbA
VWIGKQAMQGCISCHKCSQTGVCVFNNGVYAEVRNLLAETDGLVVGSPTYYAGPNGSLCALLDRVFYSCQPLLQNKPAAAVGICRRAGSVAAVDRINKYFEMSNMPQITSQYWNLAFGLVPGDVVRDDEGLQTMRTLAHNMAWILKAIQNNPAPKREEHMWTHFLTK